MNLYILILTIVSVSGRYLNRTNRDLASQNRLGNNNMLRKIATHDKTLMSVKDQVLQHFRNSTETSGGNFSVTHRENSRKIVKRQFDQIQRVRRKDLLRNLWLHGHARHLRKSS